MGGVNNAETARMYTEFLRMQTLASSSGTAPTTPTTTTRTRNNNNKVVEEMNREGVVRDRMLLGGG